MFLEKEAYWVTIRVLLSSPCHKSHRLWIPLTISQLNCDLPILINKPFFSSPPKKLETSKELLPLALALSSTNWDIKAYGKSRLCLYNPWALTFPFRSFSNRAINFCQYGSPSEVSAIVFYHYLCEAWNSCCLSPWGGCSLRAGEVFLGAFRANWHPIPTQFQTKFRVLLEGVEAFLSSSQMLTGKFDTDR